MTDCHDKVKNRINALYNMLIEHDGYGEIRIDFRILKRGQKEVIIHCGKQYRYVVDGSSFTPEKEELSGSARSK